MAFFNGLLEFTLDRHERRKWPKTTKTLGVSRIASAADIQRPIATWRKYHPDMNPDDKSAKGKFQEVQRAFDVLTTPAARALRPLRQLVRIDGRRRRPRVRGRRPGHGASRRGPRILISASCSANVLRRWRRPALRRYLHSVSPRLAAARGAVHAPGRGPRRRRFRRA